MLWIKTSKCLTPFCWQRDNINLIYNCKLAVKVNLICPEWLDIENMRLLLMLLLMATFAIPSTAYQHRRQSLWPFGFFVSATMVLSFHRLLRSLLLGLCIPSFLCLMILCIGDTYVLCRYKDTILIEFILMVHT